MRVMFDANVLLDVLLEREPRVVVDGGDRPARAPARVPRGATNRRVHVGERPAQVLDVGGDRRAARAAGVRGGVGGGAREGMDGKRLEGYLSLAVEASRG